MAALFCYIHSRSTTRSFRPYRINMSSLFCQAIIAKVLVSSKSFFFFSANFATFYLTTTRFPICFFFDWNLCPNQQILKIFPPHKTNNRHLGKTLQLCVSGVNNKLIFDKIYFKFSIGWMVSKIFIRQVYI